MCVCVCVCVCVCECVCVSVCVCVCVCVCFIVRGRRVRNKINAGNNKKLCLCVCNKTVWTIIHDQGHFRGPIFSRFQSWSEIFIAKIHLHYTISLLKKTQNIHYITCEIHKIGNSKKKTHKNNPLYGIIIVCVLTPPLPVLPGPAGDC